MERHGNGFVDPNWMHQERCLYDVRSVDFGKRTELSGSTLIVNAEELVTHLGVSRAIADVRVELARPDERTRIVHALDAVPALSKSAGRSGIYPGLLGPAVTAGDGRTHRLRGVNIVTVAAFPQPTSGTRSIKHGLIDMWGPAAPFSVYAQSHNVVLVFEPASDADNAAVERDIRLAGLRAGRWLSEAVTAQGMAPAEVEVQALPPADSDLPRVVYIVQMQDQSAFRGTYLYGASIESLVPTVMHPNEFSDGAVVSANYHIHMKVSTQLRTEDPIIAQLRERHGRDLNFAGVIISRGHQDSLMLKQRSAQYAAKLARMLGAAGAVLTFEGSGNAFIDYMLTIQACTEAGVKPVAVVHEVSGPDGTDEPLVDAVPAADALVTVGSNQVELALDAPERVIGPSLPFQDSLGNRHDAHGPLQVRAEDVFCSLASMAMRPLTAADF